MEDENVSTLLTALKLDDEPLNNQFMYVEELNNADGSFILSVLVKYQIERKNKIILITCHNSLGHFHSIGQKLGYNLMALKESGEIYAIEILEKITNENFLSSSEPLRKLYFDIKEQLNLWGNEVGVCIIMENLGNFLFIDCKEFFTFINYIRAMVLERKNSSAVLSMHNFPDCPNFNKITKSIRHFADVTVFISDLQTGRANDITGHLTVTRKENKNKKTKSEYQYQLQDKRILVFTPGSRSFL